MKKLLKSLLIVIALVLVATVGLIGWLSITEYKPDDIEALEVTGAASDRQAKVGEMISLISMNVGYGGLGAEQDFFMDGGTMTRYDFDLDTGGVGDRHVDLFWGAWTLRYNLGTDAYRDRFFDAYGRDRIDPERLRVVAAAEVFG